MTSHDAHFKQLLRAFFAEFLQAFVPELARDLDVRSIEFLDKELVRLRGGRRASRLVDLVAKVRFQGETRFVLVHVEHQAGRQRDIARRILLYALWLFEQTGLPVYPILLTSYDQPRTAEPDNFTMEVRGLKVLEFHYRVVQLNRLDWREYVRRRNPAATALMVKMKIAAKDRTRVRVQIQRLLVEMRLNPFEMDLIAGFVSTYLKLTAKEYLAFQREVDKIEDRKTKRKAMKLMTEWERKGRREGLQQGRQKGRQEGRQEGEVAVVLRLLTRRLGPLPAPLKTQIDGLDLANLEALAEGLLDIANLDDLKQRLQEMASRRAP